MPHDVMNRFELHLPIGHSFCNHFHGFVFDICSSLVWSEESHQIAQSRRDIVVAVGHVFPCILIAILVEEDKLRIVLGVIPFLNYLIV